MKHTFALLCLLALLFCVVPALAGGPPNRLPPGAQRYQIYNTSLFSFRISTEEKELLVIPPGGVRNLTVIGNKDGHNEIFAHGFDETPEGPRPVFDGRAFKLNVCGAFMGTRVEWVIPDMGDVVLCAPVHTTTHGCELKMAQEFMPAVPGFRIKNATTEFVRVIGFGRELLSLAPGQETLYRFSLQGELPDTVRLEAYGFPASDPHRTLPLYRVTASADWKHFTWTVRNPLGSEDPPFLAK